MSEPKKRGERWVCDQCGAIHFVPIVEAAGKCPTCSNPTGKVKQVELE